MAENHIEIRAERDDVFRVLLDPGAYGVWVVGPDAVVDASDDWPRVGARFTHQGPRAVFRMRDVTEIEHVDPPRRLILRVSVRPAGVIARVCFELSQADDTTTLTMTEEPVAGVWRRVWNPVFDRLLWARNEQALQRFRVIVERRDGDGAQALETAAVRPGVPTLFSLGTTLSFWALSAVRGKRIFHPIGDVYEGEVAVERTDEGLARLFEQMGTRRAIVRLSKGAGTPGGLPDVYGLAVKFPDAWGAGADQDFLLATSGEGVVGRHVLVPTTAPLSARFSSLLPYDFAGRSVAVGARVRQLHAASRDDLRGAAFSLDAAATGAPWQTVATITVRRHFEGDISFDPWNSSSRLHPSGMLNALRRAAYVGSRSGRADRSAA